MDLVREGTEKSSGVKLPAFKSWRPANQLGYVGIWLNLSSLQFPVYSSFPFLTWVLSHVWLFVTPMDCSLPGSSVHWIFRARMLDWVAISFWGGLPNPEFEPASSALAGTGLTWEAPPLKELLKGHNNPHWVATGIKWDDACDMLGTEPDTEQPQMKVNYRCHKHLHV